MEKLGSYELTGHLTSQNSGYSVWGFGKKNGRDYFIKQFLSPKYPHNDTVSSPASLEKKKKKCAKFERSKTALYQMINDNSDGNAVRIEEFFRVESKYYISMRKIDSLELTVGEIASMTEEEKRFHCGIIAHAIHGLHKGHVVHADLKHDNILFMKSRNGSVTAKVIDFDSGFLETDPPADGEEIVGDLVYFSPEACLTFMGEEPELTCKMDIFALGVLFHQYFTGELPDFDPEAGSSAGEAVARGGEIRLRGSLPEDVHQLLSRMLRPDHRERPTAAEVYEILMGKPLEEPAAAAEELTVRVMPVADPTVKPVTSAAEEKKSNAPFDPGKMFFTPGDL
ncbi:MAG: protein kinase [Oscillospiraceae bacterium]|nr:protein kinase [Oscillospiraceae bacterium]